MSFSVIKATAITVIFKTARRIQLKRKSLLVLEAFYFNKSLLIVRIYSQKRSPVPCVLATFLIQTAVPPCQKPPSTFSKVWLQLLSSSNAACCHLLVKQLLTQEMSTFNLILIVPLSIYRKYVHTWQEGPFPWHNTVMQTHLLLEVWQHTKDNVAVRKILLRVFLIITSTALESDLLMCIDVARSLQQKF